MGIRIPKIPNTKRHADFSLASHAIPETPLPPKRLNYAVPHHDAKGKDEKCTIEKKKGKDDRDAETTHLAGAHEARSHGRLDGTKAGEFIIVGIAGHLAVE